MRRRPARLLRPQPARRRKYLEGAGDRARVPRRDRRTKLPRAREPAAAGSIVLSTIDGGVGCSVLALHAASRTRGAARPALSPLRRVVPHRPRPLRLLAG